MRWSRRSDTTEPGFLRESHFQNLLKRLGVNGGLSLHALLFLPVPPEIQTGYGFDKTHEAGQQSWRLSVRAQTAQKLRAGGSVIPRYASTKIPEGEPLVSLLGATDIPNQSRQFSSKKAGGTF